jgi:molybdenum cofactor cytidylyltransferase
MASGMSKRFGSNKLITDFNGRSLFENAVSISHFAGFGETLAVTRHDEVVRICEDKNIHFLRHDMPYRNEMVRLGVTRILSDNASSGNPHPQGILFLPSDQPLITRTSLQLLCLTFLYYDDKICRLSYNENAGSPCIFPAKYYDELLNLPEKKGGGFLTKKYPAQVVLVPVRDEYELYDIDTPDDITRLLKFLH